MTSCSSCGLAIPDGQGSSCSMCYGDPGWGSDGYYAQQIAWAEEEDAARRQAEFDAYVEEHTCPCGELVE